MSTKTFVVLAVTILSLTISLKAQDSRGSITGRVIDSTGASIVGAEIRAINRATGAAATARSNESGNYTLPLLPPGAYDLTAEFSGFKRTQRPGIEVRVNEVVNIPLEMQVGNATESVEVKGGAPLLESSNVSLGQVIDQRRIEDLPVQAGNANEMVLLTPGVVNSTNLRQRKTSFNSASSQFSTDGNPLYSNEYTIDGVPDTFSNGG